MSATPPRRSPVLAAQMGYLPGTLWILAGVVFAGAVQDMTVLFLSTRRDGRSLGDMVRSEMGPVAGANLTGRPSYYGVKDYDLAYFDGADCMSIRQLASDEAEWRIRAANSRAVRRRPSG